VAIVGKQFKAALCIAWNTECARLPSGKDCRSGCFSFIAILAQDFANYWNHRAMHLKWLWPVHAIHHSESCRQRPLTTYRIHILEALVDVGLLYHFCWTWLGMARRRNWYRPRYFLTFHNVYVHINVDWGHGPACACLIASPRFQPAGTMPMCRRPTARNLANVFPLFDWMFGTYRVPGPCNAPVGAAGIPRNDVVEANIVAAAGMDTAGDPVGRGNTSPDRRLAGVPAPALVKTMPFDIKAD